MTLLEGSSTIFQAVYSVMPGHHQVSLIHDACVVENIRKECFFDIFSCIRILHLSSIVGRRLGDYVFDAMAFSFALTLYTKRSKSAQWILHSFAFICG